MRRMALSPFRLTVATFICGLLLWHVWFTGSDNTTGAFNTPSPAPQRLCSTLPGANDTLVVLKTGSTELEEKLPVHLKTTTTCYPNYMIFSDYEEYFQGNHVFDALESVDKGIRETHPDFELYRRLKEQGREAVISSGVYHSGTKDSWTGNAENAGWKLDKWKFLPMVKKTLLEYPDMKWYVFVEVDTYVLWASLLQYLSVLDPQKSIYMGSQMYIGPDLFAHGGSGFMVSQPAMRTLVSHYDSHKQDLEEFTDHHWAGDCVLGKAFTDSGVHFTNAWPITQGDYPGIVPYAGPDGRPVANSRARVWCYPVVTYHHVPPETITDLWDFEQSWIREHDETDAFLRHKDMFNQYIIPRMPAKPKSGWDNESDQEVESQTLDDCQKRCQRDNTCRQYSFQQETGKCRIREDPRLGIAKTGFQSGWLLDRIDEFRDNMAPCNDEGWLT